MFVGPVYEIGSVGRSGAFEHLCKVLCDRVLAQVEFLTDLNIRQPTPDKLKNGTLTSCEGREPSVVVRGRITRQARHRVTPRSLPIPFWCRNQCA